MMQKELRNFLTASDALGDRLPDGMIVALLKLHAGFGKRELELHTPVEQLVKAGWAETVAGRLRLTASAKARLGLTGKQKKEPDHRVADLIEHYREIIYESQHFDPKKIHEYGSLAKAAAALLKEAAIHPLFRDKSPEEQLEGVKKILCAMLVTTDNFDRRFFLSRRWHLWAFNQKWFPYIEQVLAAEARQKARESMPTGKGKL